MIASLTGKFIAKTPSFVHLDVNGVGYEVQISLNFLAADLEFLKIIAYHALPHSILSKFTII